MDLLLGHAHGVVVAAVRGTGGTFGDVAGGQVALIPTLVRHG